MNSTTYRPVIVEQPKTTNHVLHLLLTVFTFGLWAPVWFLIAMKNYGNAHRQVALIAEELPPPPPVSSLPPPPVRYPTMGGR